MDVTEEEIDGMSEGDEIDTLLAECGLYNGEGSPSTDEELAHDILNSKIPMFGGDSFETFDGDIEKKPEGGFEAKISNSDYSIEAEAETEALAIAKILAKYCVSQQK